MADGKPWPKDNTTWEPMRHLGGCDEQVSSFWEAHPELDRLAMLEQDGEHRCKWCCKFYKTAPALKGHLTKGCPQRPQKHRAGSKAERVVTRMKKAEAQKGMDHVLMGETELENVYDFAYLGHHFQADGDALHAVEVRLAMASARFGKLHHIWSSPLLPVPLKIQLYSAAVCSILTHAHEAWKLDASVVRKLRGWNGKHLAIITRDELEDPDDPELFRSSIRRQTSKPDWDLVAMLRVRRLRWVGHILRQPDSYLVRRVLLQFNTIYPNGYPEGSLLMDAPQHDSVGELIALAGDHADHTEWNLIVIELKERLARANQ